MQSRGGGYVLVMQPRGLTLLELLCSIAVIVVLLAITLTSLLGSRQSALGAVSLVRVRECHGLIVAHTELDQGRIPVGAINPTLGDSRGQPVVSVSFPNGGMMGMSWFAQSTGWNVVLRGRGEPATEAWYSPRGLYTDQSLPYNILVAPADYTLGHGFLADRSYFDGSTVQDASLCRSVRMHEIAHPGQKGMLFERTRTLTRVDELSEDEKLALSRPVVFVDGHAVQRTFAAGLETVPNSLAGGIDFPVLTTRLGVSGRDFN